VARRAEKLEEVANAVAKSHPNVETLSVSTDIADPASVAALFEKVKEKYGHADVLVNNAGIFKAIGPVKDVDQGLWWDEMVNTSALHLSAYYHPLTRNADTQYPWNHPYDAVLPQAASFARDTRKNCDSYHRCGL
jgi:NADP-dependent 3-hydroxy acid dehydrogenase YdfG